MGLRCAGQWVSSRIYSSGLKIRSRSLFSFSCFTPWAGLRSALPLFIALLKMVLNRQLPGSPWPVSVRFVGCAGRFTQPLLSVGFHQGRGNVLQELIPKVRQEVCNQFFIPFIAPFGLDFGQVQIPGRQVFKQGHGHPGFS